MNFKRLVPENVFLFLFYLFVVVGIISQGCSLETVENCPATYLSILFLLMQYSYLNIVYPNNPISIHYTNY